MSEETVEALAHELCSIGGSGGAEARALHALARIEALGDPALLPDLVAFALRRSDRLVAEIGRVAAALLERIELEQWPSYDKAWRTATDARFEAWNWLDVAQLDALIAAGDPAMALVAVCASHRDKAVRQRAATHIAQSDGWPAAFRAYREQH